VRGRSTRQHLDLERHINGVPDILARRIVSHSAQLKARTDLAQCR
jgi:hypothetical protein